MGAAVRNKLSDLDLVGSVEAIGAGDVSSEELSAFLLHVGSANDRLNAFSSIAQSLVDKARQADRALQMGQPIGPLHGVPIAFKDNIDTLGLPTTGGTGALSGYYPQQDAAVAKAIFDAGGLLFGKNTMQELAFGVTCRVTPTGPIKNPHDLDAIPGGSSGGTAAAVAAGIVPAGIGTDTGGSVRVPAALCGVAGFRPSVGRWPTQGILPISHTRDTPGPIARSVRDLALLDAVVTGRPQSAPRFDLRGLRIGMPLSYFWEGLDAEVEGICQQAVEALAMAGAEIVPVVLPDIGQQNAAVSFVVALHEPRQGIQAYLAAGGSSLTYDDVVAGILSQDVRAIAKSMEGAEAARRAVDYIEVMASLRPRLVATYAEAFSRHNLDLLVFPTTPLPAHPVDDRDVVHIGGQTLPAFSTYIRNTDPGSNAGIPGITLNAGYTRERLPVGLAFDGPAGGDDRVLSLAAGIERILLARA